MRRAGGRLGYLLLIALLSSIGVFAAMRAIGGADNPDVGPAHLVGKRDLADHVADYIGFVGDFVTGDWGNSRVSGLPVVNMLGFHGRNTLVLGAVSLVLVFLVGVPLGLVAGFRRGRAADAVISTGAAIGLGFPHFWLGLLLVWLFGPTLGWLPAAGCCSVRHLILPALVLSAEGIALTARMTRATVIEILDLDFVRTLHAAGIDRPVRLARHVLRNALIPLISIFGLRVGQLVGAALIVEVVFGWPGLGFGLVTAVLKRDFPVAQAFALLLVLTVVIGNWMADIAYSRADPRLRRSGPHPRAAG